MFFIPRKQQQTNQPSVAAAEDSPVVVLFSGTGLRNIAIGEWPTNVGTPTKTINKSGQNARLALSTALRFARSPNIGTGDFLATVVVTRIGSGSYEYILSGTTAVTGAIHLFLAHASCSGQWGVAMNSAVFGSGSVLTIGTQYTISILRIGAMLYFLQDGIVISSSAITGTQVFLDSAWAINEYKPGGNNNANCAIAHLSVLRGTFLQTQAAKIAQNPWSISKCINSNVFVPSAAAGGNTLIELTLASFGFSDKAIGLSVSFELALASFLFSAKQVQSKLSIGFSSALLNLQTAEISLQSLIYIASSTFGFVASSIDLLKSTIVDFGAASFNFISHSIQASSIGDSLFKLIRRGRTRFRTWFD